MGKGHNPRRGSMQFWPRVRAKRIYPRIRSWLRQSKDITLLGFIGYKSGMTHIQFTDNLPNSPTKGQTIFCPVTVVECPSIKTLSLRFYKKTPYGLSLVSEVFSKNFNKELKRKINLPKKENKIPENYDLVRVVVYTNPKSTGIGKKKPEVAEFGISGSKEEQLEYAKNILNKEIKVSEILKPGQLIDVHAVTKGKGYQGPVKRFGVRVRQHKSEKTKRGPGAIGSWGSRGAMWRVAHAGKMGYHTRTEYNKWILKTDSKPEEINPKSGFLHYGLIKNDYLIIKGSISGHVNRPVILTYPIRPNKKIPQHPPNITYISLESKQG